MRVIGTIKSIELHVIPSKIKGEPGRTVSRLELDIEEAVGEDGAPVPPHERIGPFQGPAGLTEQFSSGQRVAFTTTTPSGMHIADIELAGGEHLD